MRAALVVAIALLACGGSQKKTGGGVASGAGSSSGSAVAAGSGSSAPVPVDGAAPLTHDECAALIGHTLDIAAAEAKGALAPQGDEQAAVRKQLIDELAEQCIAQTPRSQYACGMAAKTSADFKACVK
jgi:hypothetical protein